jgi:hypothetical protein
MSLESDELFEYISQERPLYEQKIRCFQSLAKKVDRHVYDPRKAPQMFKYLIEEAAKRFHKEFHYTIPWYQVFTIEDRRELANDLTEAFRNWFKYDRKHYVNSR